MRIKAALAGLAQASVTLRDRDFRRWFLSQLFSASGASTQNVGTAWLVVQLHGGGVALALVTGAVFIPTLLFGAAFGSFSDRYDRRRLLITTQVAQIVVSGCLAAVTGAGLARIWLLIVFALAGGTIFAIDAPARQVYVLDLVGAGNVAGAISLNEVMLNASRVLGPAVGGALLAVGPVWVCFAVNAASFVPPLVVLLRSSGRQAPAPAGPVRDAAGDHVPVTEAVPTSSGRQIRAGVRYALASPVIRSGLLVAVAFGAVYNTGVIMPLMATKVFHLGGAGYGALLAVFGLGAVPGAILSAAGGAHPRGVNVVRLTVATGLAVLACSFAPAVWLLFVSLGLVGGLSIWLIARANALVLLSAEPLMRGRVMGVWTVALPGTNPLTGLLVGATAAGVGPRLAYACVGLATILVAVIGRRALLGAPPAPPGSSAGSQDNMTSIN